MLIHGGSPHPRPHNVWRWPDQAANPAPGQIHERPSPTLARLSVPNLIFVTILLESAPWPSMPPTLNLFTGSPVIQLACLSAPGPLSDPGAYSQRLSAMNPLINLKSPEIPLKSTFQLFFKSENTAFHSEVAPIIAHGDFPEIFHTYLIPKYWIRLCQTPSESILLGFHELLIHLSQTETYVISKSSTFSHFPSSRKFFLYTAFRKPGLRYLHARVSFQN